MIFFMQNIHSFLLRRKDIITMEIIANELSLNEKLEILSDAAKYDVACTSSGSDIRGQKGKLGNSIVDRKSVV